MPYQQLRKSMDEHDAIDTPLALGAMFQSRSTAPKNSIKKLFTRTADVPPSPLKFSHEMKIKNSVNLNGADHRPPTQNWSSLRIGSSHYGGSLVAADRPATRWSETKWKPTGNRVERTTTNQNRLRCMPPSICPGSRTDFIILRVLLPVRCCWVPGNRSGGLFS